MTELPEKYLENMQKLLGAEYGEFLSSYEKKPCKGLRFNIKKARRDTVEKLINEWELEKVPWCETGYYYPDHVRPGLSPYHDAGVFYIQEPSAMCVAEIAGIRHYERVLDLCAAPGGKSTAAAERCGVLLSNEIMADRARILSSNIERMGFSNTVVSQTSADRISSVLSGFFDVVICDAPCSGEGMMRKDETAVREWSPENVELCIRRQKDILHYAARSVRPGGRLVYSTCTFEPGENEEQVQDFLSENPDFLLQKQERIWPHKVSGEGHFCAVMLKEGDVIELNDPDKDLHYIEKRLSADKIHILRSGITEGGFFTDKKGKKTYVPSHSEIMSKCFEECTDGMNVADSLMIADFLSGNVLRPDPDTVQIKGKEGFIGVYFDGYPVGLGKRSGYTVKNHLPKGLRRFS